MTRTVKNASRRTPRGRRAGTPRTRHGAGFTLIETALATVIVGVGVLAMMEAQMSFHQQNNWSSYASIAERLGNEIREMTLNLPRHDPVTGAAYWGWEPNELQWVGNFDDLDDFDGDGDGVVFSADWDDETADDNGPINARREIIANMKGWSQQVFVRNVDPFQIGSDPVLVPIADASSDMIFVEVVVFYQGPNEAQPSEMSRVSWLAPN